MSQPDLRSASVGRGIHGEKPRAGVYTLLLVVALLALLVGCLFLFLEIKYQKQGQPFFGPLALHRAGQSVTVSLAARC